ncbi:hypothetical protein ABIA96_003756 [Bradyrhizobium sp. LB11.1]
MPRKVHLSSKRLILFSLNRGPFPGKYPSNVAGT